LSEPPRFKDRSTVLNYDICHFPVCNPSWFGVKASRDNLANRRDPPERTIPYVRTDDGAALLGSSRPAIRRQPWQWQDPETLPDVSHRDDLALLRREYSWPGHARGITVAAARTAARLV
jgi:hypothetical protein